VRAQHRQPVVQSSALVYFTSCTLSEQKRRVCSPTSPNATLPLPNHLSLHRVLIPVAPSKQNRVLWRVCYAEVAKRKDSTKTIICDSDFLYGALRASRSAYFGVSVTLKSPNVRIQLKQSSATAISYMVHYERAEARPLASL